MNTNLCLCMCAIRLYQGCFPTESVNVFKFDKCIKKKQTVDYSILCLVTGQSGLGLWTKIFWESTVCGLDDCDQHLRAALQLWECVGRIMGAGRREREM